MAEVFRGGLYQDMEVDAVKEVRIQKSELGSAEFGVRKKTTGTAITDFSS
jgi:hypothetical protein